MKNEAEKRKQELCCQGAPDCLRRAAYRGYQGAAFLPARIIRLMVKAQRNEKWSSSVSYPNANLTATSSTCVLKGCEEQQEAQYGKREIPTSRNAQHPYYLDDSHHYSTNKLGKADPEAVMLLIQAREKQRWKRNTRESKNTKKT